MSLQHFNTSWASSQWPWACVCQQAEVGPADAVDVVNSSEEESGNCLEVKQKIISESAQEILGWGAEEVGYHKLI